MTIQEIEAVSASCAAQSGIGWQCVIDLHHCATPHLDDIDWVRRTMLEAARRAEATVVSEQFHRFQPHGISGVVVIGESHLAIHIWPEREFAAVDVFTCNSRINMRAAAEWLADSFGAADPRFVYFLRGREPIVSANSERAEGAHKTDVAERLARDEPRDEIYIDQDDEIGGHWFVIDGMIATRQTPYQRAEILQFAHFGRALVLDGKLQSAERDEYIYHEALVQPALCAHCWPRRVLIIGGGEGATAREVLKHPTIEEVVMVDVDSQLVALAREHLHSWHRDAFSDPRLEIVICDGNEFIRSTEERFNVIIVDIVDSFEDGPAEALYTAEFYRTLKKRLAPGGTLVVQGMEFDTSEWQGHLRVRQSLKELFGYVRSYLTFIPSYASTWGFVMASDTVDPRALSAGEIDDTITRRRLASQLTFYDGKTHQGLFALPKDLRALMGEP
jgi:spermidine synthase